MNLGAIDIGSNAARVLIMEVKEEDGKVEYNKLKLLRYPIRLGFDAFSKGEISEEKGKKLIKMCIVFKHLMELYDVKDYRAFATSAMRESKNGQDLIQQVKDGCGMKIEIINGLKEANILYQTHFGDELDSLKNYLYVDVGGGSTEVTLFKQGGEIVSKSFKIGTIRILHKLVGKSHFKELENWITEQTKGEKYWGIASGGNINTLFGLSGKLKGEPITRKFIKKQLKTFKKLSVKELMDTYSFKSDRADVIVPALKIYHTVFKSSKIKTVFVPKIGLADGMIRLLSKDHLKNN